MGTSPLAMARGCLGKGWAKTHPSAPPSPPADSASPAQPGAVSPPALGVSGLCQGSSGLQNHSRAVFSVWVESLTPDSQM